MSFYHQVMSLSFYYSLCLIIKCIFFRVTAHEILPQHFKSNAVLLFVLSIEKLYTSKAPYLIEEEKIYMDFSV